MFTHFADAYYIINDCKWNPKRLSAVYCIPNLNCMYILKYLPHPTGCGVGPAGTLPLSAIKPDAANRSGNPVARFAARKYGDQVVDGAESHRIPGFHGRATDMG